MRKIRLPKLGGVYLVMALVTLLLQRAQLELPLCRDEGEFYAAMAHHFQAHGLIFFGDPAVSFEIYHPPGYYLALGLLTAIAGWKLSVLRVAACLTSALLPTAIYVLARTQAGVLFAATATAVFLVSPLYLCQSVLLYPDLLAAALVLFSLHAALQRRLAGATVCLTLACAVNGSALASVPFLFLALSSPRRPELKRLLICFGPGVIVTLGWAAYFLVKTGGVADLDSPNLFGSWPRQYSSRFVFEWPLVIFLASGRLVFTAVFALLLLLKRPVARRSVILLTLFLSQLIFLASFRFLELRYAAVPIAALSVAGAWSAAGLCQGGVKLALALGAAGVAAAVSLWSWYTPHPIPGLNLYNVRYFENVKALKALADELQTCSPAPLIFAEWPWSSALTKPFLGFVSKPLRIVSLSEAGFSPPLDPERGSVLAFPGELESYYSSRLLTFMNAQQRSCAFWSSGHSRFNLCALRRR